MNRAIARLRRHWLGLRQAAMATMATMAALLCAAIAGCATLEAPATNTTASLPGTRAIAASSAQSAIAIGRSTKQDVEAALGRTTRVSFDSGYEVWVYRWSDGAPAVSPAVRPAASGAEFVVLFNPSGVVAKTRLRQPPAPPRS
jgi:hypothetical protein